jgi:hypothetical protein
VSRRAHASGRELGDIPLKELDAYWEEAKGEELSAFSSQLSAEPEEKG